MVFHTLVGTGVAGLLPYAAFHERIHLHRLSLHKALTTDVNDDGDISIADKSGTRTWIKDKRIVWPDGLYVAPDRSVVVTVNQLNRAAIFNDGKSCAQKPYLIIRIK